jgi:hypothetical protein
MNSTFEFIVRAEQVFLREEHKALAELASACERGDDAAIYEALTKYLRKREGNRTNDPYSRRWILSAVQEACTPDNVAQHVTALMTQVENEILLKEGCCDA